MTGKVLVRLRNRLQHGVVGTTHGVRAVGLIALCLAVVTGVGGLAGGVGVEAARKVEISVTNWAAGEAAVLFESYLQEFERLHPDIDVKFQPLADYTTELLVRIASDTAPDVILLDNPYVPTFVDRGLVEDLTPYAEEHGIRFSDYPSPVLKVFSRGNKIYGLPKGYTPIVMAYNRFLLDDAGVAYPKSGWTNVDYLSKSMKLVRDNNGDGKPERWGTVFVNWVPYIVPQIWSYGVDIFSPDGKRASGYLNSRATVDAIQFLLDLALKHHVAPTQAELDAAGGGFFTKGISGFSTVGHWAMMSLAPLIKSGSLSVGVVDLPKGVNEPNPTTVIYATAWAVTKQSKHKHEAVELVKFLAGPWVQEKETIGNYVELPGRLDTTQKLIELDPLGVERDFLAAARYGRAPWGSIILDYNTIESMIGEAITNAWVGGKMLQNELESVATRIDVELKKREALLAQGK